MHELVLAAALLHGNVMATNHAQRGDSLNLLIDLLAKSDKPAVDKLDALFFAVRGRFATANEHWQAKHKFGDHPTPAMLKEFVAEVIASRDGRSGRRFPSTFGGITEVYLPEGALPIYGPRTGFGGCDQVGYYFPVGASSLPRLGVLMRPGFLPNPLALPLTPWIPPGSTVPLTRVGADRGQWPKP